MTEKKGILVVSFGTVYAGTRQLTIDAIRNTIQEAHPECAVYEAWTSRRIIRKLLETTGERIRTVGEALEEMERDGIREVYIQPTHVIDGIENERMKEEAGAYEDGFQRMVFAQPLIASGKDMEAMVRIIQAEHSDLLQDEALILMGHGSAHVASAAYEQMNQMFRQCGRQTVSYTHLRLGTGDAASIGRNRSVPDDSDRISDLEKSGLCVEKHAEQRSQDKEQRRRRCVPILGTDDGSCGNHWYR